MFVLSISLHEQRRECRDVDVFIAFQSSQRQHSVSESNESHTVRGFCALKSDQDTADTIITVIIIGYYNNRHIVFSVRLLLLYIFVIIRLRECARCCDNWLHIPATTLCNCKPYEAATFSRWHCTSHMCFDHTLIMFVIA